MADRGETPTAQRAISNGSEERVQRSPTPQSTATVTVNPLSEEPSVSSLSRRSGLLSAMYDPDGATADIERISDPSELP